MALRIACDLDGTLADMRGMLQYHVEVLFGRGISLGAAEELAAKGSALDDWRMKELWDYVSRIDNFWQSLQEVESGAVARFHDLATTHRWEVIFLTQRPATAGDTAQRQTQRWLRRHGFDLPSVMVTRGSRGKVAAALNLHAIIDDRIENCLDVVSESKALPLLVWRGAATALPPGARGLGVEAVSSFGDALDRLTRLTPAR